MPWSASGAHEWERRTDSAPNGKQASQVLGLAAKMRIPECPMVSMCAKHKYSIHLCKRDSATVTRATRGKCRTARGTSCSTCASATRLQYLHFKYSQGNYEGGEGREQDDLDEVLGVPRERRVSHCRGLSAVVQGVNFPEEVDLKIVTISISSTHGKEQGTSWVALRWRLVSRRSMCCEARDRKSVV